MRFVATLATCAFVALPALRAGADLLTFVADGRYVLVDHCPALDPCEADSRRPPTAFADFDDEASGAGMTARQQTTLSNGAESATLGGTLDSGSPSTPPLGTTVGDAVFDLTFEAEEGATFAWSGTGSIAGGGYGGVFLTDLTADEILFETSLPADRTESGVLSAGHRYRLYQHATTQEQGSADWEFELSVGPEPRLPVAFAWGLALASLLRRRARGGG